MGFEREDGKPDAESLKVDEGQSQCSGLTRPSKGRESASRASSAVAAYVASFE
jgi:hypothetical protein